MPTFNLVQEPWIRCVDRSGAVVSVGLAELLRRSHELVEVVDESPLVVAALHRLVLAIVHRNLGPRDVDEWEAIWKAGRLPEELFAAYWEKWSHRFDLFDADYPFYQAGYITPADEARSVTTLMFHLASGNNATLVDHSVDERPASLTAAEAGRALVAHQTFALGGMVGYLKTCENDGDKIGSDGPAARGAVCLLKGANLFETLLLNLANYDALSGGKDLPAWERADWRGKGERTPDGRVDLFTWQSRRVRLFPETADDGDVRVSRVKIVPGNHVPLLWSPFRDESVQGFVLRGDAKPEERPWFQFRVEEGKAVWRDSSALLHGMQNETREWRKPMVMGWIARLVEDEILRKHHPIRIEVLGVATKQQKVLIWRREQFSIAAGVTQNPECRELLRAALQFGDSVATVLRRSLERLAAEVLAPSLKSAAGRPDANRVKEVMAGFGCELAYWGALAVPFQQLLFALSVAESLVEAEQAGARRSALEDWAGRVRNGARAAYRLAINGVTQNGRGIRAVALGETSLQRGLAGATKRFEGGGEGPERS